ncbi:MAG: hypothetical protein V3W04_01575 [Gammaproteobacteria bacterium]
MNQLLLSVIESPMHPNFSSLYRQLDIEEIRLGSQRKAISQIKSVKPDYIVADFMYGYGNNYAGVNISNLDVLLYSMQKYCRDTGIIVFVDKSEAQYVDKLNDILPLSAVMTYPVNETQMKAVLTTTNNG